MVEPAPDLGPDDRTPGPPRPPLTQRFPALRALEERYRSRHGIPVILQMMAVECGAACLAMVLGYFGKHVRLEQVREKIGVGRDGVDALSMLKAARWYGLRCQGIRLELDDLDCLPAASILYWEFNHFVVFERHSRRGVHIVDPTHGRRIISKAELGRAFTGVALTFEPSSTFAPSDKPQLSLTRYFSRLLGHKRPLSRVLAMAALVQVLGLAVPVLTGLVVDTVIPRADLYLLTVLGLGVVAIVTFTVLSHLVRAYLLLGLRTQLDAQMTLDFLEHLTSLPFAFFQQRSAGDLLARVNSNARIREILTSSTLSALVDGTLVLSYLAIIVAVSPSLGAVALALGALRVLVFMVTRRRQSELLSQGLQAQSRSQGYLVQALEGMETLKSIGAEKRAVDTWSQYFSVELNNSIDSGRVTAISDALMAGLDIGSPLVVLGLGTLRVLSGEMSLGTMLGISALVAGFLAPLAALVRTGTQFLLLGSYIERLDDVLTAAPEQVGSRLPPPAALRGHINLEKVSFRYSPSAPLTIRDVTLEVKPGQTMAIVGPSGSGKSTLARLLLGLYTPTGGGITIDGQPLDSLDLPALRGRFGIVTQQTHLFGASIRANIALADPGLALDRVIQVARLACIHDDITAMPMGYETVLQEGGSSLSGGQRQRVALARALANRPAILVLDEATSALDAVSEQAVQTSLETVNATKIIIAHRLSTIVGAQTIVVLDDGAIVEQGTHQELLERQGSYAALIKAQMNGGAT
jgi:ATP-binding cassette, subfamily B, bacterial